MNRLRKHSLALVILLASAFVMAGTRVNAQGSDLINAAAKGDLPRVKALLAANADVNATTGSGTTPLMLASDRGRVEVVRALLDAKADVNAKDKTGMTALLWAADKGNSVIVRILVAAKADVNAKDKDNTTALQSASLSGKTDTSGRPSVTPTVPGTPSTSRCGRSRLVTASSPS